MEAPTVKTAGFRPDLTGSLQQGERTDQVGLNKRPGSEDGAVHVAFGGKMDEGVDLMLVQDSFHQLMVADITLHKGVTRRVG